jgi:hypothetical protein
LVEEEDAALKVLRDNTNFVRRYLQELSDAGIPEQSEKVRLARQWYHERNQEWYQRWVTSGNLIERRDMPYILSDWVTMSSRLKEEYQRQIKNQADIEDRKWQEWQNAPDLLGKMNKPVDLMQLYRMDRYYTQWGLGYGDENLRPLVLQEDGNTVSL